MRFNVAIVSAMVAFGSLVATAPVSSDQESAASVSSAPESSASASSAPVSSAPESSAPESSASESSAASSAPESSASESSSASSAPESSASPSAAPVGVDAGATYDIVFDEEGKPTVGKPGETIIPPEIFNNFVAHDGDACFSVDTGSPRNMHWNDVDQFVVVDSKKCRPKLQMQDGTCHHHMDLGNRCSAFCQTSGFYYYAEPIDLMNGKMCRNGEGCELKREESFRVDISNTEVERHIFDTVMSVNPTATWGLGWKTVTIGGQTIGGSSEANAALMKRGRETYRVNGTGPWRMRSDDPGYWDANTPDPVDPPTGRDDPRYAHLFPQEENGSRDDEIREVLERVSQPYTWKDKLTFKLNKFTDHVRYWMGEEPKHDHTRPDINAARAQYKKLNREHRKENKKLDKEQAKIDKKKKAEQAKIDKAAAKQQKKDEKRRIKNGEAPPPEISVEDREAELNQLQAEAAAERTPNAPAEPMPLNSFARTGRGRYDDAGDYYPRVRNDDAEWETVTGTSSRDARMNYDGPADSAADTPVKAAAGGFTIPKINIPVPTIKNPQFTVAASFSAHWTRDWTRTYHHSIERASFFSITHKQLPGEGCGAFWAVPVAVAYCGWLSLPRVPHHVQERATHWLKSTDNPYSGSFKLGSWPGPDAHHPTIDPKDPHPAPMWNVTSGRCPVNYHEMPYCQATPLLIPDPHGGSGGQALQRTVWRPYDCETGELLPSHMQPREVREQINFDEFFKYHALKDPRLYNPHLAWYPLDDGASQHGGVHM